MPRYAVSNAVQQVVRRGRAAAEGRCAAFAARRTTPTLEFTESKMVTITEKRFLQLLLLLPVITPVVSLPLGVAPLFSFVPFILGLLIYDGWIFYLPFCVTIIALTARMQSTRNIVKLYIFSPFIFAFIFYFGIKLLKHFNLYEEYFGYNFGNVYGVIFITILICYFYIGLGKLLYELFLNSKYLRR
ncbi:hypothetical protein KIK84_08490 [Curvibacter sp. CHRR-16]|uniref:hypothetical protein n=1 Tax=Curvibacter sp. CHRR-16 TaxID=2835872 RepID=UPI001BD9AFED|nr:hypothetical protein [Curvibacter sp. CHRR-16]MBT0570363.1 hypothetical protein [Curvibacter sp. CHRR-16]